MNSRIWLNDFLSNLQLFWAVIKWHFLFSLFNRKFFNGLDGFRVARMKIGKVSIGAQRQPSGAHVVTASAVRSASIWRFEEFYSIVHFCVKNNILRKETVYLFIYFFLITIYDLKFQVFTKIEKRDLRMKLHSHSRMWWKCFNCVLK